MKRLKLWDYGEALTIAEAGEEICCRGFIQPLSALSPEKAARLTPMGLADDRRYLLIVPPEALGGGEGAEVSCGERVFRILRCELMGGGSHWEGIMKLKAGGDDAA